MEGGEAGEPAAEITAGEAPASELTEAAETGQASEAAAIAGVESAPDADVAEVHTHGEEQPRRRRHGGAGNGKADEESKDEPS